MDLVQRHNDETAQTDITLGGVSISADGVWAGKWESAETGSPQNPTIKVAPTSATIVHFFSVK